jgi:hypothetical protein
MTTAFHFPLAFEWTQQPDYPVELDAKYAGIIAFASVSGRPWKHDLKTKSFPTKVGTVEDIGSQHGMASKPTDSASGLRWTGIQSVANTGDGYAVLVLAKPSAQLVKDRHLLLGSEAASTYPQAMLAFNMDSATAISQSRFTFVEYLSGFKSRAQSTVSQIDGDWHVFIANRPAGTSAPVLYRDGINVTESSTAVAGIALPAGVYLHVPPTSSTEGSEWPNALLVVFNRPLVYEEIKKFSSNVWQLLGDRQLMFYFDAIATGITERSATDTVMLGDATSTLTAIIDRIVADGVMLLQRDMRAIDRITADGLLILSHNTSELGRVLRDSIMLADVRISTLDRTLIDSVLMASMLRRSFDLAAADRLMLVDTVLAEKLSSGLDITITDTLLLADSVNRTLEKFALDHLLLTDSVTTAIAGAGLVIERLLTDGLLLSDSPIRELLITAGDALLMKDAPIKELLRNLIDNLMLVDSAEALIVTGELEILLRDGVLMEDQFYFDRYAQFRESIFLSDARMSELLRELHDSMLVADGRAMEYGISSISSLLLSDVIERMWGITASEGLLFKDEAATVWTGVVIDFLVYARLKSVDLLGIETSNRDLLGITVSNNIWRVEA